MENYRWLNEASKVFLERDYLLPGQTLDERVDIICSTAERILNKPGYGAKLKANIQKGWYSLSTPIWANFGTKRGLPISCFGSYIGDSMESILKTISEVGMMTKVGGGTSAYFGDLRNRGAKITDNGSSSGAVHFMQPFDNIINVISQGNTRRGNFAAYLPIEHKDIMEHLTIKSEGSPLQDISFGVTVTDKWMEEMQSGDMDKRKVWAKVLQTRAELGYPYIIFIDNMNNYTVDVYKDKNMKIKASNLCVIGSDRAVSSKGLLTVGELYELNEPLTLYDNNKVVKASPMKLIEKDADVYKVTLENGMSHTITSYHKLKLYKEEKRGHEMVKCEDLKIGDKVCVQTNKGIFGEKNMEDEAYLLGLYQGDGTQNRGSIMIDVWEKDFDLVPQIEECLERIFKKYDCAGSPTNGFVSSKFRDQVVAQSDVKKKRLETRSLKRYLNFEKGIIPQWIWESDEKTHWAYVKGLLQTDGTVYLSEDKNEFTVSLANINKNFLSELQIIFANLGLNPKIKILREEGKALLPDGKGGHKFYDTKTCWRLYFSNKNDGMILEQNTGFLSRKEINLDSKKYRDNSKKSYKIVSIEYVGKEDVYCTTVESDEHLWICNGFITSNCTEIALPSNEEESFVCDLASLNILFYDEWKDTDAVEILVYLLDAVATDFVEKAKNIAYLERAVRFAERHRAIGIGQLGWHSYLQSKMIPFEGMEAKILNVSIAKNIKEKAYAASEKLAQEYGEPEVLKGYGRRNTTLLAIAPTKSSAFILGQVSENIEPQISNYYIKDLAKIKYTYKNPHLLKLLEEKGQNTPEVWNSILMKAGSVQHLSFLTDREKSVFKTFSEISPMEVIIQASQRQKYIDQAQSLNLMVHPSIPVKDVNSLIIEAWKLGIKSLYYQFNINAAQNFTRNILECSSCEA